MQHPVIRHALAPCKCRYGPQKLPGETPAHPVSADQSEVTNHLRNTILRLHLDPAMPTDLYFDPMYHFKLIGLRSSCYYR